MRPVLPILALLYALGIVFVLAELGPTTVYAEHPLGLAGGIGMLLAGSIAWIDGRRTAGALAALAGACWLAPVWTAWPDASAWVRSTALPAAPFALVLVAHLAVRRSRLVLTGYAVAVLHALVLAAVHDPFYDLDCWQFCGHDNVFLVHANPEAVRVTNAAWTWSAAAFSLAVAGLCAIRLTRMTPPSRRIRGPLMAAAAVAAVALAAHSGFQPVSPDDPRRDGLTIVFLGQSAALSIVALALLGTVVATWMRRSAVGRLVHELGVAPPPGSLETVLRRLTGDRGLTVAYRLAASDRHVDSTGAPISAEPAAGQTTTSIVRNGRPVAVVRHDPGGRELAERIGSAARLAIDNERLRAEILAHLAELKASRARVVEVADETRRRLERDLHDGAQQSLLAVCFELRLAGDPGLEVAHTALRELRELAHGIFPAVLDEAGLAPALWSLTDDARVPVELDVPEVRLPPAVESAIYLVVRRVIEMAEGPLGLRLQMLDDAVRLDVEEAPMVTDIHLMDRIGALGGVLSSRPGRLEMRIPI